MKNLHNSLNDVSLGGKIKVSTVHSMAVLKQFEPPSSRSFDPSFGDLMKGLLGFNDATGSPFAISEISDREAVVTIRVNVDLVAAARKTIGFLRNVAECQWLHQKSTHLEGIDFFEFKPSEIAASVAISVSEEIQEGLVDIDNAISSFKHVEKGREMKCLELIRDLSFIMINGGGGESVNVVVVAEAVHVPQSPVGVLDVIAACSSYNNKSGDDLTVGSCANSSHTSSPNSSKKRKLDNRLANI